VDTPQSEKPGIRWLVPAGLAATLGVLVGAATPAGAIVVTEVQRFMDFYSGVFTLVGLTLSVVAGLVATDRMILKIQHRILAQAMHRAATLVAMAFLVSHVVIEILTRNADAVQVLLPIGRTSAIAVGTPAAQLMIIVALTGVARARFATGRRPWLWRAMHGLAYVAWLLAIIHGMLAGRQPAIWVTWSYLVCVAGVGVALLARGLVTLRPRGGEAEVPPESRSTAAKRKADRAAGRSANQAAEERVKVPR
jgi:DMSO/TMAO reductase YedYZ heme-binding membrane subunit